MTFVTVLSDGRVAFGSSDKTIGIWNLSSGEWKCEAILEGHTKVKK